MVSASFRRWPPAGRQATSVDRGFSSMAGIVVPTAPPPGLPGLVSRIFGAGGRLLVGAVLALGLVGPAAAQNLFGLGGDNGADMAQRRQAELNLKIQQLEGQIRNLNGQLEQMGFQVRQLQDGMTRMQKDFEYRLQEIENGQGGQQPQRRPQPGQKKTELAPPAGAVYADDGAVPAPPAPIGAAPGRAAQTGGYPAAQGGVYPAAPVYGNAPAGPVPRPGPGAPPAPLGQTSSSGDPIGGVIGGQGPLDLGARNGAAGANGGVIYAPAPQAVLQDSDAPPGVNLGPPPPQPRTAAVTTVNPRLRGAEPGGMASPADEYDAAYGYILNGEYELAETSFRTFLANHPTDKRSGSALYWLGESLLARNMFREAGDAFLKSYTQYPDGRNAPDSLLKLGIALQGYGERKAACTSYDELLTKYPKASKPIRDRAQAEKIRAKC